MKNKQFVSAVTAVTIMFSGIVFPGYIPFSNNYNEITATAFSLKESYSSSAVYTAECIINGLIEIDTGNYSASITKYSDVIERNYAYEQLAKNVMEDKGLVITSTMWDTFNKALSVKLVSAVDTEFRQEQIYEVFLMDYLTFSEGSTENSNLLDRAGDFADKTMKYESKVFKQLLNKGIADDEKSLVDLIESSDSLNDPKIVEAIKELNWEKNLVGYTKVLDNITKVATNAKDYLEAITKAMALKEVNDERIEFLKSMAAKASDDEAFQTAVSNIIDTIESSYGEIAFSEGVKKIGTISWDKCWGAITKKIPFFSTFKNAKDAMNYLFNTDSMAENNIRIIMQYTTGQYAQQVLNSAYYAYKINSTEENAAAFNEAYKNYLAYQDYSSEWAKDFVEAVPFASSATVDEWLSDLNSDINYCNSAIGFVDKYTDIYNKAVYYSASIIKPSGTTSENPNNPVTPPSGTVEKDIVESGQWGDNVYYTLYDDGYLYISGSGDMYDFNESPIENKEFVKEVSIVKGITSIGNCVFNDCTNLRSITIPDSVTKIEDATFYGCTGLTSITIPDSVTTIGSCTFACCGNLENITLPDSITIGSQAFYSCGSLKSIKLPNNVTIENHAFEKCTGLTNVIISNSVKSIDGFAFAHCENLKSITIPGGIVTIEEGTFFDCESLESIIILDGIINIDDNAFYNCASLTNITIPDSVTTIGGDAFRFCKSLTNITIPDSVTTIGYSAFMESGLTSIAIPDSVAKIGKWGFRDCEELTSVTILNKDCDIFDDSLTISANAVIYGYTNSTAQAYAEKYNREFVAIDEPATTISTTAKSTTSTTTTSATTSKTTASTTTTSTATTKPTTSTTVTSTTKTSKPTTSTTTTSATTTSNPTTSTTTTSTTPTKPTTSEEITTTTTTEESTTLITMTSIATTSKPTTLTITTTSTTTSKPTTSTTTTSTTATLKSTTLTTTTSATTTSETTTSTTTKESTTSTTSTSIITTEETITTTTIEIISTTIEPTTTTTISHIASDEELCNWAINDYQSKTGVTPVRTKINENSDGQYEIILTDDSGNILDTYVINPDTGVGTNSANEEVNLPQTGNNSLTNILIAVAAFMMIVIGFCTVKLSSITYHKKDDQ